MNVISYLTHYCEGPGEQPGMTIQGPVIIEDFGSTIRVLNNQSVEVRPSGVLVVSDDEVDK